MPGLAEIQYWMVRGLAGCIGMLACHTDGNVPLTSATLELLQAQQRALDSIVARQTEMVALKMSGNHACRGPGWDNG